MESVGKLKVESILGADLVRPLRVTDLLSNGAYAAQRLAWGRRIAALNRTRRIQLGPHLSLCFEDHESVQRQVQEVLLVENATSRRRVEEELAEYAVLVPTASSLTASLMITGGPADDGPARRLSEGVARLELHITDGNEERAVVGELTDRPIDACPVRYLKFPVGTLSPEAVADMRFTLLRGGRWTPAFVTALNPFTMRALREILRAAVVWTTSGQVGDLAC